MPGARAPHVWLTRRGERVSTIDLTGHYVLLAARDGGAWVEAASSVRDAFKGLVMDAYCVGKDLEDSDGRFEQAFGLSSGGASLIRPDGFVAWRSPSAASEPGRVLREALSRSLGH
jgi:putative polyketide hydroxylase